MFTVREGGTHDGRRVLDRLRGLRAPPRGLGARPLGRRGDARQLSSPLSYAIERRLWPYALLLVAHGAPVREAPGWNGLDARFANADPPDAGAPDRAEYDALVAAMRARGFGAGESASR